MFNKSVKQGFIKSYTASNDSTKHLLQLFRRIEPMEVKFGKDFCNMNAAEAQQTFDAAAGSTPGFVSNQLIMLRGYSKWCIANGYATSNAAENIRPSFYEKAKMLYVASPYHLLRSLDAVFSNSDANEISYVYRSFLWLAFMGFFDFEAIRIRRSEVFLDEHLIRYRDNPSPYRIYHEAIPDLEKACCLTTMKETRGNRVTEKTRSAGDLILRGKSDNMDNVIARTFRPIITRAFKNALKDYEEAGLTVPDGVSLGLRYHSIYLSGVFYRAYERQRAGIPPRFDDVIMRARMYAPPSTYSKNYTETKQINESINRMEQDYTVWKSVHT